jgi:hypothetical protein
MIGHFNYTHICYIVVLMDDVINKYIYLDTLVSDIFAFTINEQSISGALKFNYDISNIPEFLAVVVSYLRITGSGVEIEVVRSQGNYGIERNQAITGEELYLLVKNSVDNLNMILRDAALKQQIPEVEVVCPLFSDMENELDGLAGELEGLYTV